MEAPTPIISYNHINQYDKIIFTNNLEEENFSTKKFDEYEIIEDKTPKKYTYFIETHLVKEDSSIEIFVDPKNPYVTYFNLIYQKPINSNKEYIYKIYKVEIKDMDSKKDNIELKIYLKKDKTQYESKNIIDLKTNNFLGLIKFENYKGWLGTYKPPMSFQLNTFQIVRILNEILLFNEQIKYTDSIFYDFNNYALFLYNKLSQNKFELYILLYINIINGNNHLLIQKIFNLFLVNEDEDKNNNYIYLAEYKKDLDDIYRNQNILIDKILFYINNNTFTKNLEFYLKRFYTIYVYSLSLLKEKENIEFIFRELIDNKFDNLILSKLYLSEYHLFYKNIIISNEIKLSLINKLIKSSMNYNHLLTAFSLIAEYVNKDFVRILAIITENYGKINDICFKEKKQLIIKNYIKQNISDDLNKIEEYFNIILTNKKENKYSCFYFSVDIFLFFVEKFNNIKFLSSLERKLFDSLINFDDLVFYFIFASNIRNKNIILILQLIINNFEKINFFCKAENNFLIIEEYIEPNIKDNLIQVKELITTIVEKQKAASYNSIKFNVKLFELYSNTNDFEQLKLVKSIINIIKQIDFINEELIGLSTKIHEIGINMIKEGKIDNEKLLLFLKEDEIIYNEKKINDLVSTTIFLNQENNLRKNQCMLLEKENNIRIKQINDLTTEVNNVKNENKLLNSKIDSLLSSVSMLQRQIKEINKNKKQSYGNNQIFNEVNQVNEEKINTNFNFGLNIDIDNLFKYK